MRIGIFGGTFDPVHVGHLILAEQCREQGRLDQVWFIPAARPPHKQGQPVTPFAQRVEMLALAVAGNPAFRINELENERPELSYTVDTLEELHRREPGASFFLLLGADSVPDPVHWRNPGRIAELAEMLVLPRPGWDDARPDAALPDLRLHVLQDAPLIHISSRDLRRRAAEGRSLRYLVTRAVETYIEVHGLYRGRPPVTPTA